MLSLLPLFTGMPICWRYLVTFTWCLSLSHRYEKTRRKQRSIHAISNRQQSTIYGHLIWKTPVQRSFVSCLKGSSVVLTDTQLGTKGRQTYTYIYCYQGQSYPPQFAVVFILSHRRPKSLVICHPSTFYLAEVKLWILNCDDEFSKSFAMRLKE